ncbi:MAG: phosphopantetheine-binding protein, partial [Ignavibacteriales bacterium]
KCEIFELKNYLSQKLPGFLIPSSVIIMDSFPMTPAGKIDRQALPLPDINQPGLRESYIAPQTPVERSIAGIIEDVLRIKNIGLYDNFFELGGHSLLAIKVLSQINEFYKTDISLKKLFEGPNVAGLANAIVQSQIDVDDEKLGEILSNIEQLSDEEVSKLLSDEDELS